MQGGSDPDLKQRLKSRVRRGARIQTFWRLPLSMVMHSAAWRSNSAGQPAPPEALPFDSLGKACSHKLNQPAQSTRLLSHLIENGRHRNPNRQAQRGLEPISFISQSAAMSIQATFGARSNGCQVMSTVEQGPASQSCPQKASASCCGTFAQQCQCK